jgi:hypothetical protein
VDRLTGGQGYGHEATLISIAIAISICICSGIAFKTFAAPASARIDFDQVFDDATRQNQSQYINRAHKSNRLKVKSVLQEPREPQAPSREGFGAVRPCGSDRGNGDASPFISRDH